MPDGAQFQGGSVTPADFTSQAAFERECREVFPRGWIPMCRSEAIAGAGAQKAVTVALRPLLVLRDAAGVARTFANVCRYRSMTLVEGETRAPFVRCPYHLWAYDLEGRLQSAPFMDGVDLSGCDLPAFATEEWGGFVFVNLDGRAEPLGETLRPLEAILKPERLAGWREGFRLSYEHPWNWKVMLENFAESYHHIGAHVDTLQALWPGGLSDSSTSNDRWIALRHSVHPASGELLVYAIYPHFLFAAYEPGTSAFWYDMTPLGPDRIRLDIVGLYPPEVAADPEAMARETPLAMGIHAEDIPVCERTQIGLSSPDAVMGPLSPLEVGLAHFRRWVKGRAA